MATFIIRPKERLGAAAILSLAAEPQRLAFASAEVAQKMLRDSGVAPQAVVTAQGLIDQDGKFKATGVDAAKMGRDMKAPRVLEGFDLILLDDPSPETLARLRDRAEDIMLSVPVPMIAPVSSSIQPNCNPWHLAKINVAAARARNLDGRGVRIGIVDTGIDATHPEFAGKHISFAEYDINGFMISLVPRDAGDHGTHVAGIACGRNYGVAPEADLAVAAVMTTPTPRGMVGYSGQILAGLHWVAHGNHPAPTQRISQSVVLNASLGSNGYDNWLYAALTAIRQAPAVQLVAAIGNNGHAGVNHHCSPGNYDITLGVGATDQNDVVASFSDWGRETNFGTLAPDLSAPGVDICSSVPNGKYALKRGTSMATPMVTGTAALLIQRTPALTRNPASVALQVLQLVDQSPTQIPQNTQSGYNRVGLGWLDLTRI